MQVEQVPIDDIRPYEKNAKLHPDKQILQIARSISEFGFNQPIVVDTHNVVVVGHGRLRAAEHLGLKTVPILRVHLTDAQARAYRLADNKLNESDWSMELVIQELKDLDALDFDLDLTGFDRDLILEDEDKDDEIPALPAKAKTKQGDIYQLGPHRLMCGDATSAEDVAALMGEHKADMVWTDPPYNVNYKGRGKKTSNTIENDHMDEAAFDEFLLKTFQCYKEAVKVSAPFYVCHSSSSQIAFERAMRAAGLKVKNQIIWNKAVASMGWGDYRWKHEPIFYATFEGKNTEFYGDRRQYTVWREAWESWPTEKLKKRMKQIAESQEGGASTIWSVGREYDYEHPTQKPVALILIALTNSSKAEDLVVDFFGGSGSTLIACEKSNRVCFTMELDPKYCDVIVKRYEEYTGNKAEKISSGT